MSSGPLTLPLAVASSPYLRVQDAQGLTSVWDTNNGNQCQMYITNWSDTKITVAANIPLNTQDPYNTTLMLSPVTDVSPVTFGHTGWVTNIENCPVVAGDNLTFTVTNPQTGNQAQLPNVNVFPAGTLPN